MSHGPILSDEAYALLEALREIREAIENLRPKISFTREELQVLRWYEPVGKSALDYAYQSLLSKIAASLPPEKK